MAISQNTDLRSFARRSNDGWVNRLFAGLIVFLAWTGTGNAAIQNAASASLADVSAAVSAAARGDTVLVPAGSVAWSSSLILTKGISLIGAGRDRTILGRSGVLISIAPDATAIANEEIIRVEGFTFEGNNSALSLVRIDGAEASHPKAFKNLVVGNNRFQNTGTATSGSGAVLVSGQVRGVIFNNIFDRCNVVAKVMGNDSTAEWSNGRFPFAYGSADNLFFENNSIEYSSSFAGGASGWIETGQGSRIVVRYCNWNMANTTLYELWDIHGFQNWGTAGQTGTMLVEYYGNTASNCGGYRWINHRGGWGLFFNNIITGSGGMGIDINTYNCTAEVPGASGAYTVEVNNTYNFNNTKNGQMQNMKLSSARCGVAENQHFWNYNSAFDGATGIGRGTTAPTGNCSVGVAFWVASTPTPTVDPNVIQNGTLFKCLAPNVWTPYYQPYTYPHPLRSGTNPVVALSPASLNYGFVEVGSTNELPLTVRNAGGGTLEGTASVSPPFSILGTASYSLASNETQTITVCYVPTQTGNNSELVRFTGGGGATAAVTGSARGVLGLSFDSTSGAISDPFVVNPPNTIAQSVETLDPTTAGRAVYEFAVTNAGDYTVFINVDAPSDGANSVLVNIDAEPSDSSMIWDIPLTTGLEFRTVTWRGTGGNPKIFTLSPGVHQLIILGREAGAVLGRIQIMASIRRPAPPTNPRIVLSPN